VARIQARDLAVTGFVTAAATVITISTTKSGYEFAAVAVGFLALAAALLSCHHDILIGHLNVFQHRLCKSEQSPTNWFADEHFTGALQARSFRNMSFGFLVVAAGVLGLFISYSTATQDRSFPKFATWCLSSACLVVALCYIRHATLVRRRLGKRMRDTPEADKARVAPAPEM
jgi:hypothetical protein